MKIISIGSDRELFKDSSPAQKRIIEYGAFFGELHIIVFSKRGFEAKTFGNIFLYPTNSISRWLYIFDAYCIAKKIIRDRNFKKEEAALSAQDPFEAGLACYFIKRKFGIALQLQVHTDFLSPYFVKNSRLNKIRVKIAKFLFPKADSIRVVSQRIKNSFKDFSPGAVSKTAVLPIFIDVNELRERTPSFNLREIYKRYDFIILMASRLTAEKNIPMAVFTMIEIVKRFPKVLLLIVGDGPEKENIKKLILSFHLEKNVILKEWTDDVVSYYKTADLFLLTSDYEGYGRTAVEALACGLPVMMTDVGIAREIVKDGDNGIIIPVADRALLIQKITLLIMDNEYYKNFKKRLEYRPFSSPWTREEYLKRYKNLLEIR